MSCIFCKIAAGEIPSERVAQNERAYAFLDIQPLARGHTLVVPRHHAARFTDMPPETARAVMDLSQEVARRLTRGLGAEGVTLAVNDGVAAGQEVPHVHVHLVPRGGSDGFGPIHALFRDRPKLRDGELKEIGAKLRA